jgi:hypothetical protein
VLSTAAVVQEILYVGLRIAAELFLILVQAANLGWCVWAFTHFEFLVSFIDSWCPEVWTSFLWYTDKAAAFLDKAGAYAIVTSTPNSPEYDEIETCKTSLLKAFDQLKSWWSRALSKFIYMFPLDWNLMGPLLWLRQESQVGALLFFPWVFQLDTSVLSLETILSDTFVPNKFGVLSLYDGDLCSYLLIMWLNQFIMLVMTKVFAVCVSIWPDYQALFKIFNILRLLQMWRVHRPQLELFGFFCNFLTCCRDNLANSWRPKQFRGCVGPNGIDRHLGSQPEMQDDITFSLSRWVCLFFSLMKYRIPFQDEYVCFFLSNDEIQDDTFSLSRWVMSSLFFLYNDD